MGMLVDIIGSKWVIGTLCGLLIVLAGTLFLLLHVESKQYEETGKAVEENILSFCDSATDGAERVIWCKIYDADTVLLVAKNSLTGNEYRYLTADCAEDVKTILADAQAEMVIFWLRSNYEVIAYHECSELNQTNNIRVNQNYYSSVPVVGFTLNKLIEKRNGAKIEMVEIH